MSLVLLIYLSHAYTNTLIVIVGSQKDLYHIHPVASNSLLIMFHSLCHFIPHTFSSDLQIMSEQSLNPRSLHHLMVDASEFTQAISGISHIVLAC